MSEAAFQLACLRDRRLAPFAVSALPAWLWSTEATRILWANPAGAAIFDAATSAAIASRNFNTGEPAAAQIAQLAQTLPESGAWQAQRLRGFGAAGRALACVCARIALADGTPAILVVAAESAGPDLPLDEQVRRLLAGYDVPVAAFAVDGDLIHAEPAARAYLDGATSLAALGGDALASQARRSGYAAGHTERAAIAFDRIGPEPVLIATFALLVGSAQPIAAVDVPAAEAPAAITSEPAENLAPAALVAEEPPPAAMEVTMPIDAAETAAIEADAPVDALEPTPLEERMPAHVVEPPAIEEPMPIEAYAPVEAVEHAAVEERIPVETVQPARIDEHEEHAPVAAEAAPPAVAPAAQVQTPPADEPRYPLRFVWQIDQDGRFTLGSDEFIALIGPRSAAVLGRTWREIATELALDPDDRVAQAIATRDTWSGITVAWPADDGAPRLAVELSGLPVFDRERLFLGYRGFGVCRDLARLAALRAARRAGPAAPALVAAPAVADPHDAAAVPAQQNVVPFPAPASEPHPPTLSPIERRAFHELSRTLTLRLSASGIERKDALTDEPDLFGIAGDGSAAATRPAPAAAALSDPAAVVPSDAIEARSVAPDAAQSEEGIGDSGLAAAMRLAASGQDARPAFDQLPFGVLIYRHDQLLYANPAFLRWHRHDTLDGVVSAGGLDSLFVEPVAADGEPGTPLTMAIDRGDKIPIPAELIAVQWEGEPAHLLVTAAAVGGPQPARTQLEEARAELAELGSILDTATDGVVILDRAGRILSANRSAEALFGCESRELAGQSFLDLFAPESMDIAAEYLEGLARDGIASMLNAGRELIGRARHGGLIPLFVTLGPIGDDAARLCAVFRDITQWKKTEDELLSAKRQAEQASSAKSDFLAKISHEIRTPLNAIIGFSEVMMEERFGPIGNERYRDYLKDIHASGGHLLSLINDLLDLSKIEAGKLELTFSSVALNDLTQQCVAIMQPQANRERIIIRTSLPSALPQVLADARSVRQIVLNLLSNSIKFTGAGGQVIVSTALNDNGDVVLRVRDTGIGMSEKDLATALEPFRQLATTARAGGTGLGLPLTKALAEANRAHFAITSAPNSGTLVEIAFPASHVLAG